MSAPTKLSGNIQVFGVASGIGASDAGCADGPQVLRQSDLLTRLKASGLRAAWKSSLRPRPGKDAAKRVAELCARLAAKVEAAIECGAFPVVLGGDHSCAIGTWRGVANSIDGPLGLIWIDAHLDSHTPATSPSGALHGMPLAALLGRWGGKTSLQPWHVCIIGANSFEAGEASLLTHLGVRVFGVAEIARRGLATVFHEALRIVQDGTAGFGVTLDLDAIDPQDAPGVGAPVEGGVRSAELLAAVSTLRSQSDFLAMEITEYNPRHDRDGLTASLVVELLEAALPQAEMPASSMMELERQWSARNYDPLPVVLARGEGVYLWDESGHRYLDMMSAYSAVSLGHAHPRILRVLREQAGQLAVTSRAYFNNRLPQFLQRLCELTGMDKALPTNTGNEAVETALKAARKWAYQVKRVEPDKAEIISCNGNFHGRSIAIVAMSSEPQYRKGFGPFPTGMLRIPYGDAAALNKAITPNTAAFIVEPVQGEGGIIVPPKGYLAECARICRKHNVLLICDEVQTGLGRTGKLLACEHENVQPDGLILGKSLGGGVLPVSAFLACSQLMQVFAPGDHGSTFGGNALGARVGLETLNVLVEENLVERSAELGDYLLQQLRRIKSPLIVDIRGLGLFIGLEVNPELTNARTVCERLMARGILSKDTHETVIRFAPPLIITREQIDWAVAEIRRVFARLRPGLRKAA